jgi:hypothetical protein
VPSRAWIIRESVWLVLQGTGEIDTAERIGRRLLGGGLGVAHQSTGTSELRSNGGHESAAFRTKPPYCLGGAILDDMR